MRKTLRSNSQTRLENTILDQAVQQLLSATKAEAKSKGHPIDPDQLRKEGYSERFILKVEKA